jgi:ubiquinone/menaquinone biosynthesis C-methylase UbiE
MADADTTAEWEALAERWERGQDLLWQATRKVSEWLVGRLDPQPGETVLELSAGTGQTGFLAAARLGPRGHLISSDREPRMVAAATRNGSELGLTNVSFALLDATRLELEAGSLDGVLSRFGYILRGDPPAALAEVRRVLRPDGRLAFAVWASRERNSWMTIPADVLTARGHLRPPSDSERRLSDRRQPAAIRAVLSESGFELAELEELEVSYHFSDAEMLWRFVSELRGAVSLTLEALDGRERESVRTEIEALARRTDGEGFELSGVSIAVLAR